MTDMSPVVGGLLRIHKIISRGLSISILKHGPHPGHAGPVPYTVPKTLARDLLRCLSCSITLKVRTERVL